MPRPRHSLATAFIWTACGLATCAECHFRTHGTTDAFNGQPQTSRLVNFAPDVQPYNGVLKWSGPTSRTCTLVCHGFPHENIGY